MQPINIFFPILFKIGPVIIYTYGVMVSLAFAVCAFLIWYNAPLVRMPRTKVLDLVIVILISGIALQGMELLKAMGPPIR